MVAFFIGVGLGVVAYELVREYGPKLVAYLKSKELLVNTSAKADVIEVEVKAKAEITKLESHI